MFAVEIFELKVELMCIVVMNHCSCTIAVKFQNLQNVRYCFNRCSLLCKKVNCVIRTVLVTVSILLECNEWELKKFGI